MNGTNDENSIQPLDPFLSHLVGGTKFDTLQMIIKSQTFNLNNALLMLIVAITSFPTKNLFLLYGKRDLTVWLNGITDKEFTYRNNRLITFGGWGGVLGIGTHRVHSRVKLRIPPYPEAAEYFELDRINERWNFLVVRRLN